MTVKRDYRAGAEDRAMDKWVERVNRLGRELDETAATLHPSAWPEALKGQREAFENAAKSGPRETT